MKKPKRYDWSGGALRPKISRHDTVWRLHKEGIAVSAIASRTGYCTHTVRTIIRKMTAADKDVKS